MAKIYIDTVKYVIYATVEIEGMVEKPDVVGAIFGQTEGLLGDELDLRDLQKNGRIGRIEVELEESNNITKGVIKIPSSLDMVETCIVGAALETVDRVGPCIARIKVDKIEDTRNVKRKQIIDRAKGLLKSLISEEIPESREISDLVRSDVKASEITTYGPEKLPAGPHIDREEEIILVEGRADVINLLKAGITNVIAIGGARVPGTLVDLTHKKETTVFLDGDRGGDIVLEGLIKAGADIDFIARAPVGKEVEELSRKELLKCLRTKISFEQLVAERTERSKNERHHTTRFNYHTSGKNNKGAYIKPTRDLHDNKDTYQKKHAKVHKLTSKTPNALLAELASIQNTLNARMYDKEGNLVKEVSVRDILKAIDESDNIDTIIFDGIITQRLVDISARKGISRLVGIKIGNVSKAPPTLEIITRS